MLCGDSNTHATWICNAKQRSLFPSRDGPRAHLRVQEAYLAAAAATESGQLSVLHHGAVVLSTAAASKKKKKNMVCYAVTPNAHS